jgi:hypothetical protein
MKSVFLLCLAIGLVMAPCYWIYARFFTGRQTAMLALAPDAGDTAAWRSAAFELRPEMAPVGLILHVDASFSPNMDEHKPPMDRYNVTISKPDEAAETLLITLQASNVANGNPMFKERLLFMQAVRPGSYRVAVAAASEPAMKVEKIRLEVRQNQREPNSHVVTGGIVLLVLGLLGLIAG